MSTSTADLRHILALSLVSDDDRLTVELSDGRSISVPITWYPRLRYGNSEERANWKMVGGGRGFHWPQLDEDISVANLILGQPSAESQASFKRWLSERSS